MGWMQCKSSVLQMWIRFKISKTKKSTYGNRLYPVWILLFALKHAVTSVGDGVGRERWQHPHVLWPGGRGDGLGDTPAPACRARGMVGSSGSHLLLCLQPGPCRNSSCSWTEASSYRAGWALWMRLSNHADHLLGLWAASQDWILREVLPFCFHFQCFAANSALATSRPLKNHLSLTMALAETSHSPLSSFWFVHCEADLVHPTSKSGFELGFCSH